MDKKLYTIIVHSENFAGLLNQVTAVVYPPADKHREFECIGLLHQGGT